MSQFSTIEEAVEAVRRGRVIIVVDAEDRENEGDFICGAEKITPEIVNFMLKQGGGGHVCVAVLPEANGRLPLMVESNTAPLDKLYRDRRSPLGQDRHHRTRKGRHNPGHVDPASPPTSSSGICTRDG
jgi:3,4-dihydroxy-2-butanone 4-phosphate synthase